MSDEEEDGEEDEGDEEKDFRWKKRGDLIGQCGSLRVIEWRNIIAGREN